MRRYNNVAQSPTGQAISGATVVVTVAASPPGSGVPASVFSDDGITSISNTLTTDNLGRFAFYVPSGKYDITLSGGQPAISAPFVLANEEIADHLEFKSLDAIPLAGEVLNLTEVASGLTPAVGSINVYSKNVDNRLYYKDSTGTEIGPLVTGGGSGSPAGLSGDIQKNSGLGAFAASSINDNGSRILVSENTVFRGPNLGVDVTAFGVRAVNPGAVPSTTATISAGSNQATVVSAVGFQVGDGIAIVGADAVQTMTTPAAPTVVPSCGPGLTGLGYDIAAPGGSTTYTYQIVMRDLGQGITAASAVGQTVIGQASLGSQSTNIVSIASGATTTFTATVGSTAGMVAGCGIILKGTTDDAEFGGWFTVASVVDATHFTYQTCVDASRGLTHTTATGGTCTFFFGNKLTLPAPGAGGTQYLIYGRTPASMQLIGTSIIANLGYTDPSYNVWVDYGSPMMDGTPVPWWAPTAPPSTPVNDTLVTTITGISGNTLTLANNATTSVTSAKARFDNAPGIKAALVASNSTSTAGAGGTIRFPVVVENPVTGNSSYVTSTYLALVVNAIYQDGAVSLGDTLQLQGNWYGSDASSARLTLPPNAVRPHIPIRIDGANPGIWIKIGGGLNKVSVVLSGNGGIGVFTAINNAMTFEDCNFQTPLTGDYMSIPFYDYQSSLAGGFGAKMRNTSWQTGPSNSVVGLSATPAFVSKYNYQWDFDYVTGYARTFAFVPFIAGFAGKFHMGEEIQGPVLPMVTLVQAYPGNVSGFFILENMWNDTGAVPILANLSLPTCFTNADITIIGSNFPSSGQPVISGQGFFGGVTLLGVSTSGSSTAQLGQNFNITSTGKHGNNFLAGVHTSSFNQDVISYSANHTLNAGEGGVIATATLTFTVDTTQNGQTWDVFSQSGTTTLAASAGTLFGNSGTGSFVIPNNRGVHVFVSNGNAYAIGL